MNQKILKKLSFGFELEGFFHDSLASRKLAGEWKHDGSVHVSNPFGSEAIMLDDDDQCDNCSGNGGWQDDCNCERVLACTKNHKHKEDNLPRFVSSDSSLTSVPFYYSPCYKWYCETVDSERESDDPQSYYHWIECESCGGNGLGSGRSGEAASEYASQVYKSLVTCQRDLNLFNAENYYWGEGCGFHFHIGLIESIRQRVPPYKLFNALGNFNFIKNLYTEAESFCPCVRKRLKIDDDEYFRKARLKEQFIADFKRGEKYRFLRFHPQTYTLEFRFLAPCEHKAGNAEHLVSIVTDYIAERLTVHASAEVSTDTRPQDKFNYVLEVQSLEAIKSRELEREKRLNSWLVSNGYTSWDQIHPDKANQLRLQKEVMNYYDRDFERARAIKK